MYTHRIPLWDWVFTLFPLLLSLREKITLKFSFEIKLMVLRYWWGWSSGRQARWFRTESAAVLLVCRPTRGVQLWYMDLSMTNSHNSEFPPRTTTNPWLPLLFPCVPNSRFRPVLLMTDSIRNSVLTSALPSTGVFPVLLRALSHLPEHCAILILHACATCADELLLLALHCCRDLESWTFIPLIPLSDQAKCRKSATSKSGD